MIEMLDDSEEDFGRELVQDTALLITIPANIDAPKGTLLHNLSLWREV